MKKFLYKFLVIMIAFGMLTPAWITKMWVPLRAMASTAAGPNNGSNFSFAWYGSSVWANPANAQLSDNIYATISNNNSTQATSYFKAEGFGFNIPTGATINGVTVNLERAQTTAGAFYDEAVFLIKNDAITSTGNRSAGAYWPTSDAVTTFGSATDVWNQTLTAADVNNTNFGFAIAARKTMSGTRDARIDYVNMTVNYTLADTTPPVIASHPDVIVEATSPAGAIATYVAPNATDNIDATAPAVCTPASGTLFAVGTTQVTCNKTDAAGNPANPTYFNVIVSPWVLPGTLSAEDFGVVNYDTGLGLLKGYSAGFGVADTTFAGATSVVVKLYAAGDQLLQTNTAILPKFNADVTGTQFSSPFDVSGSFDYATDGYWTNVREAEFGQNLPAVKVVATVTLANSKVVTATNSTPTGPKTPAVSFISPTKQLTQVVTGTAEVGTKIYVNGNFKSDVATGGTFSVQLDLAPNTSNNFSFTAKDAADNESLPKNITIVQDSIAPATPNFSVSNTESGIQINWDLVSDALYYEIWRSSSPYALLATVYPPNHSYLDKNVLAGHAYSYKIIAFDSAGNASAFQEKNITFPPAVVTAVSTTEAVVSQPATPQVAVSTPSVTTPTEQGQIKGADTTTTQESEKINWTPWIILFILIILAGAATGGYFYWFGKDDEEEIISAEVLEKNKKPVKKDSVKEKPSAKKSKRW